MPALSFQPWKAVKVESGESRQTIRQIRKRPIKADDRLYLWQQQRTPQRRKLGEAICTTVELIHINRGHIWLGMDTIRLPPHSAEKLAIDDGFESLKACLLFFHNHYGHSPFVGVLIKWDALIHPQSKNFD